MEVSEPKMCVLNFSTILSENISHSKKNSARYDKKCVLVFMQSTRYPFSILMKIEFSRQIFEKYSNIKFSETPSSENRVVLCGRKDRET